MYTTPRPQLAPIQQQVAAPNLKERGPTPTKPLMALEAVQRAQVNLIYHGSVAKQVQLVHHPLKPGRNQTESIRQQLQVGILLLQTQTGVLQHIGPIQHVPHIVPLVQQQQSQLRLPFPVQFVLKDGQSHLSKSVLRSQQIGTNLSLSPHVQSPKNANAKNKEEP